jgi:beta-glucanase (GH16 family)
MRPDASDGGLGKPAASMAPDEVRNTPSHRVFAEERRELERVLNHQEIARSANLVRFLSFICNKYFDGESRDIREQSIAVDALGRKQATFDSHADPIVRVTARTLRRKLREIYEQEGSDHNIQIVLPLGHYVPEFIHRATSHAAAGVGTAIPHARVAEVEDEQISDAPQQVKEQGWRHRIARSVRAFWKPTAAVLMAIVVFAAGFILGRRAGAPQAPVTEAFHWGDPVWNDEFNGPAQQLPDPSKWTYEVGNPGTMGSRKLIYCTPAEGRPRECDVHRPNAFEDGAGHLVLRAEKKTSGMWTSARMTTRGVKNFQYGRIEARMRLPVGAGLWPSFWLLGANLDSVGWPGSGSITVMENVSTLVGANGLGPTMIRSTLHGPRYFGYNGLWHDYKFPNGARVDDDGFHTYGVIWSPGLMQFYVDDPANVYCVLSSSDLPAGGEWVFDHPFFLVMNLAIGGDWPGDPDASTPNPAQVLVDWVRVYKIPTIPAPSIEWQPIQVTSGAAAASAITLHARGYAGRVRLGCTTDSPAIACSLATPVVNFSETLSQVDTLTLSTDTFTEKGRNLAPPGRYKVTITATTMSGDRAQLTAPFDVKN